MELSREVLTLLSALTQGRHKRPPHVCDGGLAGHAGTGTYSWGQGPRAALAGALLVACARTERSAQPCAHASRCRGA